MTVSLFLQIQNTSVPQDSFLLIRGNEALPILSGQDHRKNTSPQVHFGLAGRLLLLAPTMPGQFHFLW